MAVPSPAKAALRRDLAARRHALSKAGAAAAASHTIAARVLDNGPFGPVVALYHALAQEVDTAQLIGALADRGHVIALPRVEGRTMRFRAWQPGESLIPGPRGLQEPEPGASVVAPDTIIVPLLGFDRACQRIGYGAGYYDRVFPLYPNARRIGIAWAVQECTAIPADPWDVPLHAIATEQEWITP